MILRGVRSTHILVDGERGRRVLEEDIGHPHFERSQLRHLFVDLRGNQVAPSGRSSDCHRSLRPFCGPGVDLGKREKQQAANILLFIAHQ